MAKMKGGVAYTGWWIGIVDNAPQHWQVHSSACGGSGTGWCSSPLCGFGVPNRAHPDTDIPLHHAHTL